MPSTLKLEGMAVNSKDIESLWKQYSEEGVKKGISVVQFFESNGVPYNSFEKWYKKKFSSDGIFDCVVSGSADATILVTGGEKAESNRLDRRNDVYVSYVNIGLSNGIKVEHHRGRSTYRHRAHDNASPLQDAAGSRGIVCKGWTIV